MVLSYIITIILITTGHLSITVYVRGGITFNHREDICIFRGGFESIFIQTCIVREIYRIPNSNAFVHTKILDDGKQDSMHKASRYNWH